MATRLEHLPGRKTSSRTSNSPKDNDQPTGASSSMERPIRAVSTFGKNRPTNEDEEFQWRFGYFNANCKLLGQYNCALSGKVDTDTKCLPGKILLQGKMYITTTAVGFYSVFNDSTFISLIPTLILFEFDEIACIRKRSNALIFNNSIEVELRDGTTYFFTSYVNREKAWGLLMMLTKGRFGDYDRSSLTARARQLCTDSTSEGTTPSQRSVKNEAIPVPQKVVGCHTATYGKPLPTKLDVCLPMAIYNVSLAEMFVVMIGTDGRQSSFDQIFHTISSDRDICIGSWCDAENRAVKPQFDASFSGPDGWYITRTSSWMKPMENKSALITLPPWAQVVETTYIYVNRDRTQFVKECLIDTSGIPYADCVRLRARIILTEIKPRVTQVDADMDIIWLKRTMFKSILKSSIDNEWVASQALVRQAATQATCRERNDNRPGLSVPSTPYAHPVMTFDMKSGTAHMKCFSSSRGSK